MKVTKVLLQPTSVTIEGISLGREVTYTAPTLQAVAKQAMKGDSYFMRDTEILEDIKLVLWEQMEGIRDNPNAATNNPVPADCACV